MLLHPPNAFIEHWSAKELRNWWKEIKCRKKFWDIYERTTVPTPEQTKAEFKRRKMKLNLKGG